jgi:hypothetical protein
VVVALSSAICTDPPCSYCIGNTADLNCASMWFESRLVYGISSWDPYKEGQITALDRVQKKAAKFAHHRNSSNWET